MLGGYIPHADHCLQAFHGAGLVHRDLKPLNVIFAESSKRFKLIDLGACADLRTGTNYVPDESILVGSETVTCRDTLCSSRCTQLVLCVQCGRLLPSQMPTVLHTQDPNYCPPEQYVLPTDAPHLAKSMLSVAISPMLWAQYKPDRFDMWSAGAPCERYDASTICT